MNKEEQEAKQMIEKWFKDNNKNIHIIDLKIEKGQKSVLIEYSIGEKIAYWVSLAKYSYLASRNIFSSGEDYFWEVWEKAISGDIEAQSKIVSALEELIKTKGESKKLNNSQ